MKSPDIKAAVYLDASWMYLFGVEYAEFFFFFFLAGGGIYIKKNNSKNPNLLKIFFEENL